MYFEMWLCEICLTQVVTRWWVYNYFFRLLWRPKKVFVYFLFWTRVKPYNFRKLGANWTIHAENAYTIIIKYRHRTSMVASWEKGSNLPLVFYLLLSKPKVLNNIIVPDRGNYFTSPQIEGYRRRVVAEEIFHCKCTDGYGSDPHPEDILYIIIIL